MLTNGIEYRFFTDTCEPNLMDARPFHVFRVDSVDPALDVLSRFHRTQLSADGIRDFATELNFTSSIVGYLRDELDLRDRGASEGLIRWILASDGMYAGRVNSAVVERFRPIVQNALHRVLREIVRRSVVALDHGVTAPHPPPMAEAPTVVDIGDLEPSPTEEAAAVRIITSARELAAFEIVRAQFAASSLSGSMIFDVSARRDVPIELGSKDTTGYYGMYFNKPSWWFARLSMDSRIPWIGLNVPAASIRDLVPAGFELLPSHPFAPTRIGIQNPDDLDALGELILAAMVHCVNTRRMTRETVSA